ncbi:hypothetical protein D3C87_1951040 [compost metagenome]
MALPSTLSGRFIAARGALMRKPSRRDGALAQTSARGWSASMKASRRWPIAARVGASENSRRVRSSRRASMKPVSTAPATKSGSLAQRARNAALVLTG